MPLKLICGKCGELIFQSSMKQLHLRKDDVSIPQIIVDKLGSKCPNPSCGRKFTSEDQKNWTLKITGKKGDRAFFSKPISRIGKEVMGFTISTTSKRKHKITSNYLVKGHDEPTEF